MLKLIKWLGRILIFGRGKSNEEINVDYNTIGSKYDSKRK